MDQPVNILKQTIHAIHPLSEAATDAFGSCFRSYDVKRKHLLTSQGKTERYLYFITEGVQRIYFMDDLGHEATILFTYPYSFGGVLDSFMLQSASKYAYESLTASRLLRASFQDIQRARESYPEIEVMLNKGISLALSGILERLAEIQLLPAEEKLRRLFRRSPHVFNLIPQKYLASYLGIDPTNFSKLINSIRM